MRCASHAPHCISGRTAHQRRIRKWHGVLLGLPALRCVYCQNKSIARGEVGRGVSIERLAHIFPRAAGTRGSQHQPRDADPLRDANQGSTRSCPIGCVFRHAARASIVYNTSGYTKLQAIAALDGYVDVFLTDFKYASADLAGRFSSAPDYPDIASRALDAMFELVGPATYAKTRKGRNV